MLGLAIILICEGGRIGRWCAVLAIASVFGCIIDVRPACQSAEQAEELTVQ